MRSFDFAPFYRSTVGFDRLFSMLDHVGMEDAVPSYPPYDIERSGENTYSISLAVAGFTDADLSIEVKENTLTIRGEKKGTAGAEKSSEILYRGIAGRKFDRSFQLADHVQVQGAILENGLLRLDLMRVVPEAMRLREIPITGRPVVGAVLEVGPAKIAA
jgi:molecular chaperone IbpA